MIVSQNQESPVTGSNDCNTFSIEFKEDGVNHVEGGWPKEIDITENDQVGVSGEIYEDIDESFLQRCKDLSRKLRKMMVLLEPV